MRRSFGILIPLLLCPLFPLTRAVRAQSSIMTCQATVSPNLVRSEGLTEQMGDILILCNNGTPLQSVNANLTVYLSVPITNRVNSNGDSDLILTIDSGAGPVRTAVAAQYQAANSLSFSGLRFQNSSTGTLGLRLSNLRGDASYYGAGSSGGQQITASISLNAGALQLISNSTQSVGTVQRSLYSSSTSRLICSGYGTPDLTGLGFASAIASNGAFATVRVTEGFASSFVARSDLNVINADFGTRILIRFSGVPADAHLFVPDAIAGSNALQPTSAGDYGLAALGGAYVPGSHSLLLLRVDTTDAAGGGAGTGWAFNPVTSTAYFDSMSEVIAAGDGTAFAVYEVYDSNPFAYESATIPAFVSIGPGILSTYTQINEDVSLGPVSTVIQTGSTLPVPRFVATVAPNDCTIDADCGAGYFPKLSVNQTAFDISMTTLDKVTNQYLVIANTGSGNFLWNANVQYVNNNVGVPWLQLSQTTGLNAETVVFSFVPGNLPSGVYDAVVTIDAGPAAGQVTVHATMRLSYRAPVPLVLNVVNDASRIGGFVVAGSRADILGDRFSGNTVTVTFNGIPATVLSVTSATQLVVQAPYSIQGQQTALIVVTVDNSDSNGILIPISDSAPAIYKNAILNGDNSVNGPNNGALTGSTVQIYATGLPSSGVYYGRIHDRQIDGDNLVYAGPSPAFVGIQLLEMVVPSDLPAMTTVVYACGGLTQETINCSPPVDITLSNPPTAQ